MYLMPICINISVNFNTEFLKTITFEWIMNDTQKPFTCSETGCEMTFTNEDHLNWHQKKHDMMLNLGLTKNNDVADQTPTPTRFIRNCEEVGLFQDLQNVNPFEEVFKNAVEVTKNGGTLEVPESNSDDTLHTPHILPHIEENQKKINSTSQDDNNSQSNDFSLNVITIAPGSEKISENTSNATKSNSPPVIVIDDDSSDEKDVKKKIKAVLQNKEKQKIIKTNYGNAITVVPIQNSAIAKETRCGKVESKKSSSEKSDEVDEAREKIREMNRAAQTRCRKRKQIRWQEMEEELRLLRAENKKLKIENYKLRHQLTQMNGSVTETVKVAEPIQGTIIGTLIPVTNHQNAMEIGSSSRLPNKANSSIFPKSTNGNTTPTLANPFIIQLSVPPENLQANSVPQLPANLSNISEQKKVKRKSSRKLIPKIIIEN